MLLICVLILIKLHYVGKNVFSYVLKIELDGNTYFNNRFGISVENYSRNSSENYSIFISCIKPL